MKPTHKARRIHTVEVMTPPEVTKQRAVVTWDEHLFVLGVSTVGSLVVVFKEERRMLLLQSARVSSQPLGQGLRLRYPSHKRAAPIHVART